MSRVTIIDYGAGNLHSAQKAFERMATPLGITVDVTADPDRVRDMVKRGATISGLADVLGITPAEVERILADAG